MNKIKVLLADDHAILREGLAAMLTHFKDIEIVGSAGDGQEVIEKVDALDPDLVIMDIAMPVMSGLEATRLISERYPRTRVLVLSQHEEPQFVVPIIKAGAAGFVPKRAVGKDLIQAIRALAIEDSYYYPSVTEILVREIRERKKETPADRERMLTKREKEILRSIALGMTSAQIAEAYTLSVKTVEWHRTNIMHKLGIHRLADLVRYAIKTGLIEDKDDETIREG